jgi:hypothetical protein
MRGSGEQSGTVFLRKMRRKLRDTTQVEPPVGEHFEKDGVLSRRSGRCDAQIGLLLREVQKLHAIREHRGHGCASKQPPLVHLIDVGNEFGFDAPRLLNELREAEEELVISKGFESPLVDHPFLIARVFFGFREGQSSFNVTQDDWRDSRGGSRSAYEP